ncbi:MAG: hypothetical protein NTV62_03740 [Candidatus Gribaldobacteria bacterium]|nr:hypothetical protein [Candidatus Gribaldobacteria bacterium]
MNMLGYGDTGIHGITWDSSWGRAWQKKLMRYAYFSATLQAINKEDSSSFRKTANAYAVLIEDHDYGFLVSFEKGDYEKFKNQCAISTRCGYHFSDNYNNFGVGGTIGRNKDVDYKLLNPYVSIRFKGLTTRADSQFYFTEKVRDWQTVITLSYDLSKSWAIAGRWIISKTNYKNSGSGYIGLRRSQTKGINLFLMFGDPNAPKLKKGGAIKIIAPIY